MQLPEILPQLTRCKVHEVIRTSLSYARPCCLSLLTCTPLTSLDVGKPLLTPELWRALPAGLRVLRCSLEEEWPGGIVLNNLQHLPFVQLRSLVAVMRMAPQLMRLEILAEWFTQQTA